LDRRNAKYAGFAVIKSGSIPPITRKFNLIEGIRTSPYFQQQGADDLNFNSITNNKEQPHFQPICFSKGKDDLWKTSIGIYEIIGPGFEILQIKDNSSGRIFYTVGGGYDAYILSYEPNTKKAVQYLCSKDLHGHANDNDIVAKNFVVKNGNLYLTLHSMPGSRTPTLAYHIFWDTKTNWIGYEYVGQYNF
jgi:hypothetical protein